MRFLVYDIEIIVIGTRSVASDVWSMLSSVLYTSLSDGKIRIYSCRNVDQEVCVVVAVCAPSKKVQQLRN